ncbi:hypothetical protein GCK32_001757 [Trichostrongylus colubriformis]|uniref:Uncharacterized protein n=1 Tax=Trichostrongylus colubriformis TaxID=6319 RepID=A0AAN8EWK5_TRICO
MCCLTIIRRLLSGSARKEAQPSEKTPLLVEDEICESSRYSSCSPVVTVTPVTPLFSHRQRLILDGQCSSSRPLKFEWDDSGYYWYDEFTNSFVQLQDENMRAVRRSALPEESDDTPKFRDYYRIAPDSNETYCGNGISF